MIRAQAKRVGDTEAASRQQVQAQLVRQPEASGSNRTSELIGRLFAQTAKVGA